MFDYVVIRQEHFQFGFDLASKIGPNCKCLTYEHEYYPDGQPAPRIKSDYKLDDSRILVVGQLEQRFDRHKSVSAFHNLTRVVGNLTDPESYNARSVEVFFPYYWMSRQDHNPRTDPAPKVRDVDQGKDVGYKHVARVLRGCGASRITTFNPHFHRGAGTQYLEFRGMDGIEIVSLSAIPAIAEYLKQLIADDIVVLGPDLHSNETIDEFCKYSGLKNEMCLEKERDGPEAVTTNGDCNADGRGVLILDDIGATMRTARGARRKIRNASYVDIAVVHPVLTETGYNIVIEMLSADKSESIRSFTGTNTVDSKFSKVDVIPEAAEYFKKCEEVLLH